MYLQNQKLPLTLQWYKGQHESDTDHGRPADLQPHEVRDNHRRQGPEPQVVQEYYRHVEPIDVVRQQVHHLAHCGFAKSCFWEPKRLQEILNLLKQV